MFPTRFFCRSYFAPRYFPRNGDAQADTGGDPDGLGRGIGSGRLKPTSDYYRWHEEDEIIIL